MFLCEFCFLSSCGYLDEIWVVILTSEIQTLEQCVFMREVKVQE